MGEHKNTILAIVLSLLVVVGWQYFIGYPQMERQRQEAALKQQEQTQVQPGATQSGRRNRRAQPRPRRRKRRALPNCRRRLRAGASGVPRNGDRLDAARCDRYAAARRQRSTSRAAASTI